MSRSILSALAFSFIFAALAGSAAAQNVTLRWIPAAAGQVAGYNVYIARIAAGPLIAAGIDVGLPRPDATGVASVLLTGVDRTAPLLWVEMTAYDGSGRESARSNRVVLLGDGETLAQPTWSQDFEELTPGNRAPGFIDWGGLSALTRFADGNQALRLSSSSSATGPVVSRYVGSASPMWAPYELEGRILALVGSRATGVGVRVGAGDLSTSFILGGDIAGEFALDQVGKPNLRCARSTSTGVSIAGNQWFRFRLRYTAPDGRARLRAKVWRPGELEPTQWQADCWTDIPPWSDSGTFALYRGATGVSYWDDLVVRPVTGTFSGIPNP